MDGIAVLMGWNLAFTYDMVVLSRRLEKKGPKAIMNSPEGPRVQRSNRSSNNSTPVSPPTQTPQALDYSPPLDFGIVIQAHGVGCGVIRLCKLPWSTCQVHLFVRFQMVSLASGLDTEIPTET